MDNPQHEVNQSTIIGISSEQKKRLASKRIKLVVFGILAIVLSLLVLFVANLVIKNSTSTSNKESEVVAQQSQVSTFTHPVPLTHPGVESVDYLYTFKGTVASIDKSGNNYELTLEPINGEIMPTFSVAEGVKLYRLVDGGVRPYLITELKAKDNVKVSAVYKLLQAKWITTAVTPEN